MFKQILKLLTLILIIVMSSCQKEDLNDSNIESENSNTIKAYTFKQASQMPKFNNAYNKFTDGLTKSKRNNKSIDSDFVIDSTTVKVVTINSKTSYSMAIKRASYNATYFEDLIIQVNSQDSTRAYIAKYTPDNLMDYSNSFNFHGKTEIKEIVYNPSIFAKGGQVCITYMVCYYAGHDVNNEDACTHAVPETNCYGETGTGGGSGGASGTGSASGTSGTGTSTGGTSGTSSGTGSNGSNDGGVYTAPVIPTYTSVNLTTALSLNTDQQNWIATHPQTKKQLQQLLFANPFNTSNFTLASQIITQIMNNQIFTNINPFLIEDQIDDSTLPPCPKAIVDKIKKLLQNDFAAIIAKLGGATVPYNVEIITDPLLIGSDLADTNYAPNGTPNITPYEYQIKLGVDHLTTGTQLSIASTILHELIHAYFLSIRDDYTQNGNTTLQSFPALWNYYVINRTGTGANLAQHTQMANNYVNIIACALQEMQTGICVPARTQPLQIYQDLAWGGLEDTPAYDIKSATEKDRIQNVVNAEIDNTPQNNASGVATYFPISIPCN